MHFVRNPFICSRISVLLETVRSDNEQACRFFAWDVMVGLVTVYRTTCDQRRKMSWSHKTGQAGSQEAWCSLLPTPPAQGAPGEDPGGAGTAVRWQGHCFLIFPRCFRALDLTVGVWDQDDTLHKAEGKTLVLPSLCNPSATKSRHFRYLLKWI